MAPNNLMARVILVWDSFNSRHIYQIDNTFPIVCMCGMTIGILRNEVAGNFERLNETRKGLSLPPIDFYIDD